MKDFLKDWGIPLFIFLIIIPIYLYFNNPGFSSDVDKALERPPYLSIRNDTLFIEDFEFSVGISGFNQVQGDFDGLNEKVYNLLKGSSGNYQVVLVKDSEDKYGNHTKEYNSFGKVNTDELNKFQSVKYWKDAGGMQDIILNNTKQMVIDDPELQHLSTTPTTLKVISTNCSHASDCNELIGVTLEIKEEENQLTIISDEVATYPKISANTFGYKTTRENDHHTYNYEFIVQVERSGGKIVSLTQTVNVTYDNGITEVRAFTAK